MSTTQCMDILKHVYLPSQMNPSDEPKDTLEALKAIDEAQDILLCESAWLGKRL